MDTDKILDDVKVTMNDAAEAMARATSEIERLKRLVRRYEDALMRIEEHAQDKYDGPEDNTHGPYLAMAQEGLGIHP